MQVPSKKLQLHLLLFYPPTRYICDFFLFHIEIEGKCGWIIGGGGGQRVCCPPLKLLEGPGPPIIGGAWPPCPPPWPPYYWRGLVPLPPTLFLRLWDGEYCSKCVRALSSAARNDMSSCCLYAHIDVNMLYMQFYFGLTACMWR